MATENWLANSGGLRNLAGGGGVVVVILKLRCLKWLHRIFESRYRSTLSD